MRWFVESSYGFGDHDQTVAEDPFDYDSMSVTTGTDYNFGAGVVGISFGLLAVRISELYPSWLLWFRPEVVRTVEWGGDPHKVVREQGCNEGQGYYFSRPVPDYHAAMLLAQEREQDSALRMIS